MQLNRIPKNATLTAGGSQAVPRLNPVAQLRRLVMSCLLWEDEFYVDGVTIAQAITDAAKKVDTKSLADITVATRVEQHLRHVPLLLACELATRGGPMVSDTLNAILLRADELSEFLTLYWRNGKTPLAKQVKKGLAKAFGRFDAYQLAKYDREKEIRLRDVLFMVHAKPRDEAQAAIWKQLVDGTLPAPDTWEVNLSGGADKRETFDRLLREGKLGYFALLRNLRNMADAGVDAELIKAAILARGSGADKVLPFRFIAAARAAPRFETQLDASLVKTIEGLEPLKGTTAVIVDVSGSMDHRLSVKSDLSRIDAGAMLASMIPGSVRMFSFSDRLVEVPPRRGMAGVDAIQKSQPHSGTALFDAIHTINERVDYDRLIVITDEQDTGGAVKVCPNPKPGKLGYMINVASNKNGVGYGRWNHIDGFSENVLRWIAESEKADVAE